MASTRLAFNCNLKLNIFTMQNCNARTIVHFIRIVLTTRAKFIRLHHVKCTRRILDITPLYLRTANKRYGAHSQPFVFTAKFALQLSYFTLSSLTYAWHTPTEFTKLRMNLKNSRRTQSFAAEGEYMTKLGYSCK